MNGKKIVFMIGFILLYVAHLLGFDKKLILFADQSGATTGWLCILGVILLHFLVVFICDAIAKATNNSGFFDAAMDIFYAIYPFIVMVVLLFSVPVIFGQKSIYYQQQHNMAESNTNLVKH